MALTFNIYFTGAGTQAQDYAKEVLAAGLVERVQKEEGCLIYDFFFPRSDQHTVLLVECWESQEAIDRHLRLPTIKRIQKIRSNYDLTFKVNRFLPAE